ncbi:MAG: HAMP domain-containing histidine kinase [Actinomycetota bacterium]|nr:HAMP domain-containing histidine kinase [Actinomycetota bacterium]
MTVRRRLLIGLLVILAVVIAAIGAAEILVLRHVLYLRSAQGLTNELRLLGAPAPNPTPPTTTTSPASPSGSCAGLGSVLPIPGGPDAPGGPGGPGGKGKPHGGQVTPSGPGGAAGVAQALAAKGVASAIAGPDGTLLACAAAGRNGHQTGFTVPASVLEAVTSPTGYVTVHSQGHHLLAIAQPIGADTAILVTELGDDDTAVSVVLAVTVAGGLAALLAAAGLSRPLLRSGLAPLTKIARTADAIAGGDLDQRANLARSADEVGRLGAAFDRMVDRLQHTLGERDALVDELRTQEQTMRRFVADASHELRTPLTAIRGSAQVLRLGAATNPDDLAESLAHIQTQTERMSRLVNDLLLLSRQEAGQPSSPKQTVDLAALIEGQHPQWQTLAGDHPVQVATEPAWVTADLDGLTRACGNLIENAAKYSPAHSPITLRVVNRGGRAELSVADSGPGIPAAERTKIFDRFYRGDPARTRVTGGAGLGLAIVASIAADHHGHVRVDNDPGGGALLTLDLPLVAEHHPPLSSPRPDLGSETDVGS